jgi:hypothetical protein
MQAPLPRALRQVFLIGVVVAAYTVARGLVEGSAESARANAQSILDFEGAIGLDVERSWNGFVADRELLTRFFNLIYEWLYWPSVSLFLAILWLRGGPEYRHLRNGLFLSALVGLVFFWLFPVAPPRSLDGFIDTVAGRALEPGTDPPGGTNVYAAFPSFHVGWPAAAGLAVARAGHSSRLWLLALVPALLQAVAVVVTANHYLVDAVAGVAISILCVGVAVGADRWLAGRGAGQPP